MSADSTDQILVDRPAPGVVRVTLSHPGRMNSLTEAMVLGLPAVIEDAGHDSAVSAVVLTGDGDAFSSGADLDLLVHRPPDRSMLDVAFRLLDVIRDAPIPVIAAIDGPAAGGGWGIALGCDIRYASPRSIFIAPFIEMDLIPDYGLTESLPRLAGPDVALEICLSAQPLTAEQAHKHRLVTRVTDTPLDDAINFGTALTARSRDAIAHTKALLRHGGHHREAPLQAALLRAPTFRQRVAHWRNRQRDVRTEPGGD